MVSAASSVRGAVSDVVSSLFGGGDEPAAARKDYHNRKAHHDEIAYVERISYEGFRYKYKYYGPTDQEVEDEVGDPDPEDPTPRSVLLARARDKLRSDKRKAANHKAAQIITKYHEYLTAMKYDVASTPDNAAEVGISRRVTASDVKTFNEFSENLGNDGWLTPEYTHVPVPYGSDYDDKAKAILTPDQEAIKGLTKLADEINFAAAQISEHKFAHRKKPVSDMSRFLGNPKTYNKSLAIPEDRLQSYRFGDAAHYLASKMGGAGDPDFQFLENLRCLSRFGKSYLTPPRELPGFTFITRPRLNLSNQNLIHMPTFGPLLYADDASVQMYIRQMLDTKYCEMNGGSGAAHDCPFINTECALNTLLCNSLVAINGFPDPELTLESTTGGFFSEQQTHVIGYNRMAKGQELQLEFKECSGSAVLAMHDYWTQYMGYIADGSMCQYSEEIEQNLLGYTVSIYRFITDHTGRRITKYAKATGCFPKLSPSGNLFNVNAGEHVVTAGKTITIPYWCHHFTYNNPIIISEFNQLISRYCPSLTLRLGENDNRRVIPGEREDDSLVRLGNSIMNGHSGIPYIIQPVNGIFEVAWLDNYAGVSAWNSDGDDEPDAHPNPIHIHPDQKVVNQTNFPVLSTSETHDSKANAGFPYYTVRSYT